MADAGRRGFGAIHLELSRAPQGKEQDIGGTMLNAANRTRAAGCSNSTMTMKSLAALISAAAAALSGSLYLLDRGLSFCGMGSLFWPQSRFSDLFLPLEALESGQFIQFSEYPAGSAVILRALGALGNRATTDGVVLPFGGACEAPALTVPEALLALLAAATVAFAVSTWGRHGTKVRPLEGAVAFATFLSGTLLVSQYNLLLITIGCMALIAFVTSCIRGISMPRWMFSLVLGLAYPLMFAWDRGNLDLVAILLIVWALLLYKRGGTRSLVIMGALLGVATAVKLWPLYLVGLLLHRNMRWALAAYVGGLAAALLLGGALSGNLWFAVESLAGTSGRGSDLGSPWLLYFNRTLTSGINSVLLLLDPTEAPVWLSTHTSGFAFSIIGVGALIAATWVMSTHRELWLRLTLASTIMILAAPTSGVYRLGTLWVALLMLVWQLDSWANGVRNINRTRYACVVLLSLSISPLYLGTLPQPAFNESPWMGPPTDTLIGTAILIVLGGMSLRLFLNHHVEDRTLGHIHHACCDTPSLEADCGRHDTCPN